MPTYLLSLREVYTPWEVPTLPQLLQTLKAVHPNDEGMTVVPPRQSEAGLFKIVLAADDDNLTIPLTVGGKDFVLPLRKLTAEQCAGRLNANPRSEGLLYTLYNSTTGALADLSNADFDKAVAPYGRLTRPCEHQRHKGSSIYNGNRFFCMVANGDMPDRITIPDPIHPEKSYYVTIGYRGKSYHCARCQERHVGECPVKRDFYQEQTYRATQQITTTILADSTLRHADATGLSADIICMSGGRVGQVAHMLKDAPKIPEMKNIVVLAGTNDILCDNESEEEFSTKVSKGVELLQHQTFRDSKALTFVTPPLPPDLSVLRGSKRDRLNVILSTLSVIPKNEFTVLPCPPSIDMDGFHPTEAGTKELLKYIDATLPIIHNPAFITNGRLYNGVETAYRYGCLTCLNHLELDLQSICPTCKAADPFSQSAKLFLTDPEGTFDVPSESVHMSEVDKKRSAGDDLDATPSKSVKSDKSDGGDD